MMITIETSTLLFRHLSDVPSQTEELETPGCDNKGHGTHGMGGIFRE